jgi:ABC-2 type transport system permease protein
MNPRTLFAWSVRRELWENRAIYLAPLAVAVLAFAGFLFHIVNWASSPVVIRMGNHAMIGAFPYSAAASVILLVSWIVGIFYAADALHGERRDRSILFWKSMPVSDLVTVGAKASVPVLVIPVIACAIAFATQLAMLLAAVAVHATTGKDPATAWNAWPIARQTVVMLYGMGIHALWFAPIYGWLLLVSGWAPRAPLLWAVVPVIGLSILERIALGSSWIPSAVNYRVLGAMREGFTKDALRQPITQLSQLDPERFFSNPHLWIGLVIAAAFVALAVRLRRYREPT